jgi:hypothetical protein
MYRGIQLNDWKIDVDNKKYKLQKMIRKNYSEYNKWNELTEVIINI